MGTVYPYPLFRFRRALDERFKAVQALGCAARSGKPIDPQLRKRCSETCTELMAATEALDKDGGDGAVRR